MSERARGRGQGRGQGHGRGHGRGTGQGPASGHDTVVTPSRSTRQNARTSQHKEGGDDIEALTGNNSLSTVEDAQPVEDTGPSARNAG